MISTKYVFLNEQISSAFFGIKIAKVGRQTTLLQKYMTIFSWVLFDIMYLETNNNIELHTYEFLF